VHQGPRSIPTHFCALRSRGWAQVNAKLLQYPRAKRTTRRSNAMGSSPGGVSEMGSYSYTPSTPSAGTGGMFSAESGDLDDGEDDDDDEGESTEELRCAPVHQ
jgi:hypothetical protein